MKYQVLGDMRQGLEYLHTPAVDIDFGTYRWKWIARLRVRHLARDPWGQTMFRNLRIVAR